MRIIIIVIALIAAIVLGLFVRDQILKSRNEPKNVDRSKLKDLDDDGWDDDDWSEK